MKNTRPFLIAALIIVSLSAAKLYVPAKENKQDEPVAKPNVIIIMADDLDSKQLSCYGGKNLVTKNIDQLATEGLKFNQIICSEAICVPTRASLFTGLYPMHHGSYQNHKPVYIDRNLKSVVQYLDANGYRVGLTGKDHSTKPRSVFPFEIVKGFEPNCVASTDDYFLDSVKTYITKKDKPYCLFVMSINPHTPWTVGDPTEFDADKLILPPYLADTKQTRAAFRRYLAEVRRLDDQVGDIMRLLKETGQDKNTMLIFLGEQGAQFPGAKWNSYDVSSKSSMIARWPGKIKPGSHTNAIVQYEDITPTMIDFAGGKAVNGLDGKSILPILLGKQKQARQYAFGIYNNIPEGTPYAMRSIRDGNYKLIMNLSAPAPYYNKFMMNPADKNSVWMSWVNLAATDARAHFLVDRFTNRPALELFDIVNDPYEMKNLAADPKYRSLVDKYVAETKKWMTAQGDPGAAIDKPFRPNGNKGDN